MHDTAGIDQRTDHESASHPFFDRWHRLVSTTNWEKGRIIAEWRSALVAEQATPSEYSDDAWSSRVGSVSGQHVGRLRRVYERFGGVYDQYAGLFWSHFQAALDWNDAEMWLEGAVQNRWTVANMRKMRWETLGAPAELRPRDEEVVAAELDEDAPTLADDLVDRVGPTHEGTDRVQPVDDEESAADEATSWPLEGTVDSDESDTPGAAPFAGLPSLPDDLSAACESFKLAILRHKLSGWTGVSRADVLATLDALRQLALAPA